MNLDDHVCLCHKVSKRKIQSFIRIEKPQRVSQLSQCDGAGTGCGWCRVYLTELFEQAETLDADRLDSIPSSDEYAAMRREYIVKKREKTGG